MFQKIVSLENIFAGWREFKRGKGKKLDVREFEFNLEDNFFALQLDLKNKTYLPATYSSFYINDPKLRHIHKASVRDRVLHQAIFRVLDKIFDKKFIYDSYSCRVNKGTHKGVRRLYDFMRKASKDFKVIKYALKCDIRKFFDNIDHAVLIKLIEKTITDSDTLRLLRIIINSFSKEKGRGLPLGNVTSQLFSNIYLNELDQFIKHSLKEKYYLRYCDDFIIFGDNETDLEEKVLEIGNFLRDNLCLEIHPNKITIRKFRQGIDFLGYVVLPHYIVMRTKTKRRILKRIKSLNEKLKNGLISDEKHNAILQSYLGALKHCRGYKIGKKINS